MSTSRKRKHTLPLFGVEELAIGIAPNGIERAISLRRPDPFGSPNDDRYRKGHSTKAVDAKRESTPDWGWRAAR